MKLVGQNGSCNKWIKFKFVWLLFFVTLLTQQIEHTNTFYSHNQKVPSVHTEEKLQSLWEELTWRHFRCLVFVFLGRLYNYLFGIGQHTWNMHEVFVISDTSFNSCCFCFFKLIVKQYKDNSQNIPRVTFGVNRRDSWRGNRARGEYLRPHVKPPNLASVGLSAGHYDGHTCCLRPPVCLFPWCSVLKDESPSQLLLRPQIFRKVLPDQ